MEKKHRPSRFNFIVSQTHILLIAGFAAILALYLLLVALGLSNLFLSQTRINNIVETDNVKASLINQMHSAARERSLLLHTMQDTADPFDRDRLYLEFSRQGGRFLKARSRLLSMPLREHEQELLAEQNRLTGIAVPLQNQVVDLIQAENFKEADEVLNRQAIPAQNKVLDRLLELQQYQSASATNTASKSYDELQAALMQTGLLGLLAIIVSIFIALFIIRKTGQTERDLQLEKKLAETTLHSIGEAVITTDKNNIIVSINPVAESLTGWYQHEARGHKLDAIFKLFEEETHKPISNPLEEAINHSRIVHSANNVQLGSSAGKTHAVEYTAAPIADSEGKVYGGILTFRDVTEVRSLSAQLSYQASHDTLTGLVNRNEFEVRLQQALLNARNEDHKYALCYMDLDQFKIINDTCGHAAGDELLKQLASRLKNNLRDSDTLARLGGDEFGILFDGCELNKAREIADKLLHTVRELRFAWDDKTFEVGVSIGLVPITALSGTLSNIMSAADTACYEAKDQGRNRIHVFDANDINLLRRRGEMDWIHRINDALDNDRLTLFCQPILDLTDKTNPKNYGYEILVRLKSENGDIIPPNAFIPAAERYNLMPIVDRRIISKTIEYLETLSGFHEQIFLNISGQSISDAAFVASLLSLLESSRVDARHLTFEITETATIANFSVATQFITALKQKGCLFALDDFGSGLSSFSYLKNIPVDFLKIDGSFIRDIVVDRTDHAFVESINQIGGIMGLKTIAEFVEDEYILNALKGIGVNYAQGYHLGRPQPLNEVLRNKSHTPNRIQAGSPKR